MVTYVVIALLLLVIAFLIIKSRRKNHKAPAPVKNPSNLIGTDSGVMISQERKEENKGLSKTESFNEIIIGTSENRPYATLTVLEKDFSPGKNAKKLQMTGKACILNPVRPIPKVIQCCGLGVCGRMGLFPSLR